MPNLGEIVLNGIEYIISGGSMTDDVKQALIACINNLVWKGTDGNSYIEALNDALYPPANLESISATYTQSGTVYDTDTLDSLKSDLIVKAHYSDSTEETLTVYALSGTLTEGNSTITVSYGGKTTTFTVTVTHYVEETVTITWTGTGTDKKTGMIDATSKAAYFTMPFVSGSPYLASGATTESLGVRQYVEVYSDSAGSNRVGYYYIDTMEIESGRTVANSPFVPFNTQEIFVPQGYYGKIVLSRSGETVFDTNAKMLSYLNANANEVVLR